ncbi:hypothetical protein NEMBOFW57_009969 [Staphylotrichum longicolle]|uniref:tRNA(Ile)-lysidine synthetase n=1 Tax=Staphylotrichum longicolle TaxID=669026 RepID=A0AAD4HV60_9PEZI|nr:hypothetical protein NEMBOFW57_009969 [Staphylotrichum longicolle]
MALAYLCSKIRTTDQWFRVADHPVGRLCGLIVNHGLREGSGVEAANVANAIKNLGVRPFILNLSWDEVIPEGTHPSQLPNVETVARTLRYRALGAFCRKGLMATLFTAHHEDDQYETVMMRLLSGHGYRGLQGMRPATDIPECYDMHGVYQSGFVDDQRQIHKFYNMTPNYRAKKLLKGDLRDEVDPDIIAMELEAGWRSDAATAYLDDYDGIAKGNKNAPLLAPLEVEDGGVLVYRPLLCFGKERLIATCLEHNIPWFEDHTNADQTLTMRNAVRHMHRNHTLPVALQKPSVLRLAERCRAKIASAEAEVDRLLSSHVVIREFGANAGTLVVSMPRFSLPTVPHRSAASPTARENRLRRYRHIAALLIRRLLSMVTPEHELTQPSQLDHLISMLFPSLTPPHQTPTPPKPYVICTVLFTPLISPSYPLRWLLSRAPHVTNAPPPALTFPGLALAPRVGRAPCRWKAKAGLPPPPRLFDRRFWIRFPFNRLPCALRVMPFAPEHLKPFREALADDGARKELSGLLRRYAPGKTRFTLPAVFATVDVTGLLAGGGWWPEHLAVGRNLLQGKMEGQTEEEVQEGEAEKGEMDGLEANTSRLQKPRLLDVFAEREAWEQELKSKETLQLLALPTLGVGLPGLEEWLKWEVRYRKVDPELLWLSRLDGRRMGRREVRARGLAA